MGMPHCIFCERGEFARPQAPANHARWRGSPACSASSKYKAQSAPVTQLLQQASVQGWLLLVAVLCLLAIAACSIIGLGLLVVIAREVNQRTTFGEKVQPLLDAGELEAVVQQSRQRLMTFPDDAMAHYFLGVALQRKGEHRQALAHLRRIPELQAGWDVAAMIEATEQRLSAEDSGPELRVVPTTPDAPEPHTAR